MSVASTAPVAPDESSRRIGAETAVTVWVPSFIDTGTATETNCPFRFVVAWGMPSATPSQARTI